MVRVDVSGQTVHSSGREPRAHHGGCLDGEALASLLRLAGDVQVLAEAMDGAWAVEETLQHRPDVLVMDPIAPYLLATHGPGRSRTRVAVAVQRSVGLAHSDPAASPQDKGRMVEDGQVLPRVVGEDDQIGGCPDLDAR